MHKQFVKFQYVQQLEKLEFDGGDEDDRYYCLDAKLLADIK